MKSCCSSVDSAAFNSALHTLTNSLRVGNDVRLPRAKAAFVRTYTSYKQYIVEYITIEYCTLKVLLVVTAIQSASNIMS